MAEIKDIVLIHMEDAPVGFARVEDIVPDHKKDWYQIRLLMLQIPLQVVTWILKAEYINGDVFSMNGKSMRLEKVEAPVSPIKHDDLPENSNNLESLESEDPPEKIRATLSPFPNVKTIRTVRNHRLTGPTGILSASRRTDIPGWYTPWFLDRIEQGYFFVTNPFNRQSRRVNATPKDIHTIVFWSKNYGPFLDLNAHKILAQKGFHLFFNFTINTPLKELEPGLPDLSDRLNQARRIARELSPLQVAWRFDPICFYEKGGQMFNNLDAFEHIAGQLSQMGIKKCITSFYDPYKKVAARIKRMTEPGSPMIKFMDPAMDRKAEIIRSMAQFLKPLGMDLFLCCEKELMDAAGLQPYASPNACINGHLYKTLFGGNPETRKDYGQRRKKGCQCTRSVDIGAYEDHPCFHNCLFCYARTGFDITKPAMG